MIDKELINDADTMHVKLDVDKDGKTDIEIVVHKGAMKKWAVRIAKWLLLRFAF